MIPQRVYGRASELAALGARLDAASRTVIGAVRLRGASGSGRSAVLRELRGEVARRGGRGALAKLTPELRAGPARCAVRVGRRCAPRPSVMCRAARRRATASHRVADAVSRPHRRVDAAPERGPPSRCCSSTRSGWACASPRGLRGGVFGSSCGAPTRRTRSERVVSVCTRSPLAVGGGPGARAGRHASDLVAATAVVGAFPRRVDRRQGRRDRPGDGPGAAAARTGACTRSPRAGRRHRCRGARTARWPACRTRRGRRPRCGRHPGSRSSAGGSGVVHPPVRVPPMGWSPSPHTRSGSSRGPDTRSARSSLLGPREWGNEVGRCGAAHGLRAAPDRALRSRLRGQARVAAVRRSEPSHGALDLRSG